MLSHTDLKRGTIFILNNQPHEVLDYSLNFRGRGGSTASTRIKNLITGNVLSRSFHAGESFNEAEIKRRDLKFIYASRGQFVFCEITNPSKRFNLTVEQIGAGHQYLKTNIVVTGLFFNEQVANIQLPIKVSLKVTETAPGDTKGRATAGTKPAILESGAQVNVPPFIGVGDIVEINTESDEYVRRVE
ncbi:MAG: elongation factor P [Candidatus Portnoybacteria bacterium CG10_big_fil_rev_8_21_14_0_10_40_22]|uniref:Elongation factor P n=3 Tax=Parcubacteria group TaxID=1794811 RepID=A0A2M8KGM1_9BACT|nr:MAG: hypothetical protein AUJ33_02635 [Parcubacteria group bacterium CG1_02_40_25]PIZ70549.1 MAG: elongation factor P [Candidatus Portnoybacteria bacterium CG_4_10_14_0_2_um_filter_39_11]PJB50619.1 MAG: elongation factor P [Candidatus Brennerbacteria bacterium CG_4_9_14_3_um_filter_43_9]PJE59065.1 MAG: elongation factor P [Candidatus Portnoybacteria bacterium CG10_big_fil_rev_8_21_14_0_10_40_22]